VRLPPLHPELTERTTAATNVLIAIAAVGVILYLRRVTPPGARRAVWLAALALLAAGASLGVVAHGVALAPATVDALWQPLYLALGGSVALFVVGAVADWKGLAAARRVLPVMLVIAAGFYLATRWTGGDFRVFVAYEAAALLGALAVYATLHFRRQLPGAGAIALAFAVSLAAGVVQAGGRARVDVGWPLDHNGIFHLIQLAGLAVLARGLRRTLQEPLP
jgi:hypothetical protein